MTRIAFLSPYRGPVAHEKHFLGEAKDCFSGCLRYLCLGLVPRACKMSLERAARGDGASRCHYILELSKFFVELTRIVPWANQDESQDACKGIF